MTQDRPKAAVFAALPPPVGGVSSIVAMLHDLIGEQPELVFATPLPKGTGALNDAIRACRNVARLVRTVSRVKRGGRILFFCSAGVSFYEKLVWILAALMWGRRPVMVMVDGRFPSFWLRMPSPLRALSTWLIARKSVTVATQSPRWRDYYQGLFPKSDTICLTATVSPDFVAAAGQRSPEPGLVLYVGWIIPEKGIIDLLDAFRTVHQTLPAARLRLVGPMFESQSFWESQIAERGLAGLVALVGPITDRRTLIMELQRAAVFTLPSYFEGFPVSLIEAITLGVPSIATDVGGVPDILDDGRAGLVVPPRDPSALAAAVNTLLQEPHTADLLSKSGATRAKSLYSGEAFVDSYLQALGLK